LPTGSLLAGSEVSPIADEGERGGGFQPGEPGGGADEHLLLLFMLAIHQRSTLYTRNDS
jgi:hypothetical protein